MEMQKGTLWPAGKGDWQPQEHMEMSFTEKSEEKEDASAPETLRITLIEQERQEEKEEKQEENHEEGNNI